MELSGSANCLGPGVQVGEYRLQGVVGEGGFGIVYSARDLSLDRVVAVKEYMPSTLAGRMQSNRIHVRAQHKGAFDAGLRSFINEARLLAKFSHPALVHVYRFFEENGTAYMVMRYYEGQTFRAFLAEHQASMNERWLSAMLCPILDVLEMLHAADCFHRDIAPDNIFLQESGMPVLLDFGAARRIIGDMTQALTMVLKPGFAPIEQYADDGAMPQGAWTDVYQLGAMLYLSITGKVPPTSVARMISDPIQLLTPEAYPTYSPQFLHGVHRALAVKPQDRPQSISELRSLLGIRGQTAPAFSPWAMSGPAPLDEPHAGSGDREAGFPAAVPGGLPFEPPAPPARPQQPAQAIPPSQRIERVQDDLLSLFNQSAKAAEAGPAQPSADVEVRQPGPAPMESADIARRTQAPFTVPPAPAEVMAAPMTTIPLRTASVFPDHSDADQDSLSYGDEEWAPTTQNVPLSPAPPRSRPQGAAKGRADSWKWVAVACAAVLVVASLAWWMLPGSGGKADGQLAQPSEVDRWLAARQAATIPALEAYLTEFPAGEHEQEARALLASLVQANTASARPPEAVVAASAAVPAASGGGGGVVPLAPSATVAIAPAQPAPPPPAPAPQPHAAPQPASPPGTLPLIRQPTAAGPAPERLVSPESNRPESPNPRAEASSTRPTAQAETGKVVFRVMPWGNVRVNRSPVGTTPPLTQLELPEGQHQIEISNPAAPSVTRVIQVKKGEPVVINHKFE